jgi:undecaprenyl pyrophosphate synthase
MEELKNVSLQELELELARRKQQEVDHTLVSLPDEQLQEQIKQKEQTEFQKLHDQMFPGVDGSLDDMYPMWKEQREEKARETIKNKGKNLSLGEAFYPNMVGGK